MSKEEKGRKRKSSVGSGTTEGVTKEGVSMLHKKKYVTNFIWPYLHQFFNNSHSLNGYKKPSERPFDQCQSHLKEISIGWDIKQINW